MSKRETKEPIDLNRLRMDAMQRWLKEDGFHFAWGFVPFDFRPPHSDEKIGQAYAVYTKETIGYGQKMAHQKTIADMTKRLEERRAELKIAPKEERARIQEIIRGLEQLIRV